MIKKLAFISEDDSSIHITPNIHLTQVLDPRTRMILFKMLGRNFVSEINGCISTGKEANVYYAMTADGQSRAVKVYKTSILTFKVCHQFTSLF